MYRTSDDQLNLRDFFSNSRQKRSIKCCSWRGSWQMACQIVLSRNAPSGWHLAPHSLSQSVQYRCTAWVNFHQPQYRFTERYQFPLAPYQLSFHPTLLTYIASKDLFQFFVPFCFHASLVFCTHTYTFSTHNTLFDSHRGEISSHSIPHYQTSTWVPLSCYDYQ